MKTRHFLIVTVVIVLAIFAWACSHLQEPVRAEAKETTIEMTASNFDFTPNNITTHAGSTLVFNIRNTSGSTHNFTLKDPNGTIMQNVDIPPKQTVEVKAVFPRPGTYPFTCNKTGHTELGMKGQVVVD